MAKEEETKKLKSKPNPEPSHQDSFGGYPADAFENEAGPPRPLPFTKEGLAEFEEWSKQLGEAAKKIKRTP